MPGGVGLTVNVPIVGGSWSTQNSSGSRESTAAGRLFGRLKARLTGAVPGRPQVIADKTGQHLMLKRSGHAGVLDLDRLRKAHPKPAPGRGFAVVAKAASSTPQATAKPVGSPASSQPASAPPAATVATLGKRLDELRGQAEGVAALRYQAAAPGLSGGKARALDAQARSQTATVATGLGQALDELRGLERDLAARAASDPQAAQDLKALQALKRELVQETVLLHLPRLRGAGDDVRGLKGHDGQPPVPTTAFLDRAVTALLDLEARGHFSPRLVDKLASFQHTREWGSSPVPHDHNRAAESLAVMAEGLADGTLVDFLLGGDSRFDATALKLKLEAAAGQPLAPGQTAADRDRAITLRHEVGLAERKLARSLTIKPGFFGGKERVFSGSDTAGVLVNARLIEALRAKAGPKAGRDIAFLLANVALLRREIDRAEGRPVGVAEKLDAARAFKAKVTDLTDERDRALTARDGLLQQLQGAAQDRGSGALTRLTDDLAAVEERLERIEGELDGLGDEIAKRLPRIDEEIAALTAAAASTAKLGLLGELGLDAHDLKAMGLSTQDVTELEGMVGTFARQGLKSPAEVGRVTAAINRVIDRVVDSTMAQGMMHAQAHFSPEARARLVQLELFQAVTGRSQDLTLQADSPAVADAIKARLGELAQGTGETADALRASTDSLNGHEAGIARQAHKLRAIDERVKEAQLFLADKAQELGLDLDPHKPKGLDSALHLLRALEIDAVLRDHPPADPEARQALEQQLERDLKALKGFDATRMRQPWFGGQELRRADLPRLAHLQEVARAMVAIREAPQQKTLARSLIEEQAVRLDELGDARRALLGEKLPLVQGAVRAAVLAARADTQALASFDPSEARAKVEATLKGWGLEPELFAPEISEALATPLTPETLERWIKDGRELEATPLTGAEAERIADPPDGVDPPTVRAFLANAQSLRKGEKIKLTTSDGVAINTGKIPIEPHDVLKVRARFGMGDLNGLELQYNPDGYELYVKAGAQLKGGLDLIADAKVAEATLGVDASGYRLTGAMLRFKDDAAGKKALTTFLERMFETRHVTAEAWKDAAAVFPVVEKKLAGGVGAKVQTTLDKIGKVESAANAGVLQAGPLGLVTFGAEAGASVGLSRRWQDDANANLTVRRVDTEVSLQLSAQAGVYGNMMDALTGAQGTIVKGSGLQGALTDAFGTNSKGASRYDLSGNQKSGAILAASVQYSEVYTKKQKEVRDADGFYGPGNEFLRQLSTNGHALGSIAMLSNDKVVAILRARPDLRAALTELGGQAKFNDFVTVSYGLDEGVRARANDLLAEALELREGVRASRGGGSRAEREARARQLEREAQRLVEDEANYNPVKITLIPTQTSRDTLQPFSTPLIAWERTAEGRFEKVQAELWLNRPPPSLAQPAASPAQPSAPPTPPTGPSLPPGDASPGASVGEASVTAPPDPKADGLDGLPPSDAPPRGQPSVLDLVGFDPATLVTPGPVAPGAPFYFEPQSGHSCTVHATNAALGGEATSVARFSAWLSQRGLAELGGEGELDRAVQGLANSRDGVSPDLFKLYLDDLKAVGRLPADAAARLVDPGGRYGDRADVNGFPVERALPDAVPGTAAVLYQERPSAHYVAFRKDSADQWHLVDSRRHPERRLSELQDELASAAAMPDALTGAQNEAVRLFAQELAAMGPAATLDGQANALEAWADEHSQLPAMVKDKITDLVASLKDPQPVLSPQAYMRARLAENEDQAFYLYTLGGPPPATV